MSSAALCLTAILIAVGLLVVIVGLIQNGNVEIAIYLGKGEGDEENENEE